MPPLICKYLERCASLLDRYWIPQEVRERYLLEAEDHLLCTYQSGLDRGLSARKAQMEAIGRFGGPNEVVNRWVEEWPTLKGMRDGMWQRFTERTRRVIFFAQEEAARLGENYVGTEHLLLGVIREEDSVAARILERLGIKLEEVRRDVRQQSSRGKGRLGQEMQLTPRAKRVIDLAYEEARTLNNNYIGTEHLLLGLIREGEGIAAKVLIHLGLNPDGMRIEVKQLQDEGDTGNRRGGLFGFGKRKRTESVKADGPPNTLFLEANDGARTIPLCDIERMEIQLKSGEVVAGRFLSVGSEEGTGEASEPPERGAEEPPSEVCVPYDALHRLGQALLQTMAEKRATTAYIASSTSGLQVWLTLDNIDRLEMTLPLSLRDALIGYYRDWLHRNWTLEENGFSGCAFYSVENRTIDLRFEFLSDEDGESLTILCV